ncbi:MAG: hypothetical protein JXR76_17255 [Deltaproteobacteria bacterium]|nr:hypothetical protein [Deltaproteobacteria bacterium]
MKFLQTDKRFWLSTVALFGILFMSNTAAALDAAYSRKGPFGGVGFLGGGAVLAGEDENTGLGDLGLNLQVGLGATENFTVSLNLDNRLQMGTHVVQGLIVPGPRFSLFLTKNVYLSAGVGLAIALNAEPKNDNSVGMNAGAGVGVEHFVNTNVAAWIGLGADYFLLTNADDILSFTISLGIRYY